MLFPELLLTLLLLAVCSFAPGFFFVRRFAWSGLEKLCGSIALSLVLLWLAAWAAYVFVPAMQSAAGFGIIAVCCGAVIVVWRDASALFRIPRVRRALGGYGFLLAWTLVILSIIRVYTGAFWSGDWMEHFQRTLFFLHHFPADSPIYGAYLLPARPPMMNVLAALFLGVTEDRFEIFQVVFAFFNLLLFLPCCLALPVVARVRKVSILPLVAIFAMNPAVMQNASYTWTKALTAFFVILGVCLYLAGWRKRDSVRMTAAFVVLAAGLLVHYSAGPYCVFFALHYLVVVFRTQPKWKELAAIAVTCGLLLLTWFGWSTATYGTKPTFASNTTLNPNSQYQGGALLKIGGNIFDSFVPFIVQNPSKINLYGQPYQPAILRDAAFNIYQANVIFIMGLIGGPLVIWFVIQGFRGGGGRDEERPFWLWLIGFSVIVGLAASGERDFFGVGHLTLIPMETLGLTLLSTQFFKRRAITFAILAGLAIDFSIGVFLHARVQHLDNSPAHTYYTGLGMKQGQFQAGMFGPDSVGHIAWRNWFNKRQPVLAREWMLAAQQYKPGDPALAAPRTAFLVAMNERLAEDAKYWHGWFANHDGEITYLGDWFGDSDVPSALLVVAALGLLWKLGRPTPAIASAPVAAKVKAQGKRKRQG